MKDSIFNELKNKVNKESWLLVPILFLKQRGYSYIDKNTDEENQELFGILKENNIEYEIVNGINDRIMLKVN